MKQLTLGIIGLGTVGSSVARILKENQALIAARSGYAIVIKQGVVKDLSKSRQIFDFPITNDVDSVLDDPKIDIVVELTGGVDTPFEIAKKALRNSKAFVTANKAMLAYHRYELQKLLEICQLALRRVSLVESQLSRLCVMDWERIIF